MCWISQPHICQQKLSVITKVWEICDDRLYGIYAKLVALNIFHDNFKLCERSVMTDIVRDL